MAWQSTFRNLSEKLLRLSISIEPICFTIMLGKSYRSKKKKKKKGADLEKAYLNQAYLLLEFITLTMRDKGEFIAIFLLPLSGS